MSHDTTINIRPLAADEAAQLLPSLAALLEDAVAGGASVGFLHPLRAGEAAGYWQSVIAAVKAGERVLLAAFDGQGLAGSVQLELAPMPNGAHRAEVVKLFVHRRCRRQGIGELLMRALEPLALAQGRRLLVLDTREGDDAERLYRRLGYSPAGVIPRYARSSRGTFDATVIMYRWLEPVAGDG
jgi:acetyltransferase